MTRRMSCALTADAVVDRRKTVTRRAVDTWTTLKAGDRLTLVEKGMGLRKGERQVVLAFVEVVDVRVEPLVAIWNEPGGVEAEGITGMSGNRFAYWWARSHGHPKAATPADLAPILCRRIEWRYLCGATTVEHGLTYTCTLAPHDGAHVGRSKVESNGAIWWWDE